MVGCDPSQLSHVQPERQRPRDRWIGRDRVGPRPEHDPCRFGITVQVPLARRGRVAGHAERAAHEHEPAEQPREGGLALEGEREVRQRTEGDQRDLAGETAGLLDDQVDPMAVAHRPAGRRELRMPDAARAVRLGRRLERPYERQLSPDRDLDVRPSGKFQHRQRVRRDLARLDVARHARHRDEVRLGRGDGVQQRQAVVDAGVDVEDDGGGPGHPSMLAERVPSSRQTGRASPPARRRRAQVEPDAAISAAVAGRIAVSRSPAADHARRITGSASPSRHGMPATPSDGMTDASTSSRPPGASERGDAAQRRRRPDRARRAAASPTGTAP